MLELVLIVSMVLVAIYTAILLLYGVMFFALIKSTGKFLYLPHRTSLEILTARARDYGMTPWRNKKGDVIGWQRKSSIAEKQYLILHGRYKMALSRHYIVSLLREIYGDKVGISILEYPSYGARGGEASQNSLVHAAIEGMILLRKNKEPLFIIGESLGAAVAAQLAARFPQEISGLFLIAPFSNLPDAAAVSYPLFPIGPFLGDRYDSCEALQKYHGPVAFLLAEKDQRCPVPLGKKLYDCYHGPKKLWINPGADHNTINFSPSAPWWKEGFEFLSEQTHLCIHNRG